MQKPTPERWRRIKEVFHEAVELEVGARAAFLDSACAGDVDLRARVEELLASDARQATVFDLPVVELAAGLAPGGDGAPGQRIGRHRIVREIRRGGMGAVYLAVRDDGEYREQVALKLIKRGMDSDAIVERFRLERQILANLDHPNIARLIDGGVTEGGLPYFAMEYVDGVPIDDYCDARRLPIAQRVDLFRKVCGAVRYAHRNLVIHRDLKPSNILVTEDGEPKLLDFGIAKLLVAGAGEAAPVASTMTGQRLMTPEYASPEQVRGEAVTTASDAYSLGVVLFRLLTGHRPYRLRDRSVLEMERVICGQPPEKLSTAVSRALADQEMTSAGASELPTEGLSADGAPVVAFKSPEELAAARSTTPRRLRKVLAGDLDNIVARALRKEASRRYGSAEELSEDLRRYREGLPVTARPDTLGYRTAKFVRRHRIGVLASALVVLSLLGGIVATTWQARVAEAARQRAEREEGVKDQVLSFMNGLFVEAAKRGDEVSLRDLLEGGAEKAEAIEGPEVKAEILDQLGVLLEWLDPVRAGELVRRGLDIRRAFYGEGTDHEDVAASLNNLGVLLRSQGRLQDAERLQREALAMREQLFGREHSQVADSLNDLGVLLLGQGKTEEAEASLEEALALNRRLRGEASVPVASNLGNLGVLANSRGDFDRAETLLRQSLELLRRHFGEEHEDIANALHNLAGVHFAKGELEAAEAVFREALEAFQKTYGETHPKVSEGLYSLGVLRHRAGDPESAEALYRRSLRLDRELSGNRELPVALRLSALGKLRCLERGDVVEGEALLRESLDIRKEVLGPDHWQVIWVSSQLGACLTTRGDFDEAEGYLTRALTAFEARWGADHPYTEEAREYLVVLYDAWGKKDEAATYRQPSGG